MGEFEPHSPRQGQAMGFRPRRAPPKWGLVMVKWLKTARHGPRNAPVPGLTWPKTVQLRGIFVTEGALDLLGTGRKGVCRPFGGRFGPLLVPLWAFADPGRPLPRPLRAVNGPPKRVDGECGAQTVVGLMVLRWGTHHPILGPLSSPKLDIPTCLRVARCLSLVARCLLRVACCVSLACQKWGSTPGPSEGYVNC